MSTDPENFIRCLLWKNTPPELFHRSAMLFKFVLNKCTNHAAIHLFNDDFRKAFIRCPFTNPVDNLLYSGQAHAQMPDRF